MLKMNIVPSVGQLVYLDEAVPAVCLVIDEPEKYRITHASLIRPANDYYISFHEEIISWEQRSPFYGKLTVLFPKQAIFEMIDKSAYNINSLFIFQYRRDIPDNLFKESVKVISFLMPDGTIDKFVYFMHAGASVGSRTICVDLPHTEVLM